MYDRRRGTKRPSLKGKFLRRPGQSLQREIDRLLEDKFLPIVVFATMIGFVTIYEWERSVFNFPPHPYWLTALALPTIGYCVYKYFALRKQLERLRLGRDGERIVGQFLEHLRSQGCLVFHDIIGDEFNIDHVVVSPRGIYAIETKTYRKTARGQAIAQFDGERLLVNGIEHDRDGVQQVKALSRWLRDQLQETTGRRFPIRGVVLLPEWYVEFQTKEKTDVWVLNPKLLPSFIEREPVVLKPEDIALVSSRITKFMQTDEQ